MLLLLTQEMLSLSLDEPPGSARGRLAPATRAVAFYSTPHFGSGMAALGWKLRHVPGASPAPSIAHLSPGPHLSALNARLAALHADGAAGGVAVLSFAEGQPTSLAGLGFLPRLLIVPVDSAYPGFGGLTLLQDEDHINVCKPASRGAAAYEHLLAFLRNSLAGSGLSLDSLGMSSSGSGGSMEETDGSGWKQAAPVAASAAAQDG
jgi:protein SERAC1